MLTTLILYFHFVTTEVFKMSKNVISLRKREFCYLMKTLDDLPLNSAFKYEVLSKNEFNLTFSSNNVKNKICFTYDEKLSKYDSQWMSSVTSDDDMKEVESHTLDNFDQQAPLLFFVVGLLEELGKDCAILKEINFLHIAENFVVDNCKEPRLIPRECKGKELNVYAEMFCFKLFFGSTEKISRLKNRIDLLKETIVEVEEHKRDGGCTFENEELERKLLVAKNLERKSCSELKIAEVSQKRNSCYLTTVLKAIDTNKFENEVPNATVSKAFGRVEVENKIPKFQMDLKDVAQHLKLSKQLTNGTLILRKQSLDYGSFCFGYPVKPIKNRCHLCCFFAPKLELQMRIKKDYDEPSDVPIKIRVVNKEKWGAADLLKNQAQGPLDYFKDDAISEYMSCCTTLEDLLEKLCDDIVQQHFSFSCNHETKL